MRLLVIHQPYLRTGEARTISPYGNWEVAAVFLCWTISKRHPWQVLNFLAVIVYHAWPLGFRPNL